MIRILDAEINPALPPRTMLMNGMHPPACVEATQRWISPQNSNSDTDTAGSNAGLYSIPREGQQTTDKMHEWQTQAETEQLRPPLLGAPPLARFLPAPPSPPIKHTPPTFATKSPLGITPPFPPPWLPVIDGTDTDTDTKNGSEPQRDKRPVDEYDTTFDDQPRTNGTYVGGVTRLSSQNHPQHPYAQHGSGPSESSADVDPSSATLSDWNTGETGMTYGGHPYVRDHMSRTSPLSAGSPGRLPRSPQVYQSGVKITAFPKIKIFRSSTDELIAIRVSPRVVLGQLMGKVRERLGSDVEVLKYRNRQAGGGGGPGVWVDILNDVDLKSWIASADKLVLYAEELCVGGEHFRYFWYLAEELILVIVEPSTIPTLRRIGTRVFSISLPLLSSSLCYL